MKYTLTLMFLMSVFISVFGQKYNKLQKQIIKANYSVVEEKCKENLAKEGVKKRHRDVYLISLGDVALHQKRYVLAENYYNQVLETYLDKEKPNYVYDLEDKLALLYIETGNYLKAKKIITHVKFGRELHYKDNNHRKYRTLYTQAQYFHQLSKTDSARFYASQYVIQNKNLEFNHYNDLYYVGNAYKILTEIALENKSFEQALVYARKNETYQFHPWARRKAGRNTLNKVMALNLLADVYFALGKINRAEFFSTRSLKLYFKRIGTKEVSYVQLLLTKAKIHFANGQYENSKNDLIEGYNLLYVFIKEKLPLLTEYERERFYRKIHNQSRIMNAYSVEIISKNPKETYSKELTNKIFTYTFNTKGVLLSANNNFSRIANSLSEEDSTRYLYERWKREKGILSDYMVYLDYSNNKNKIDMQQELVNRLEKQINKEMLRYSSDFQDKTLNDQSIKEYLSDTDLLVNIIKVPTIVYKDSPYPSDSLSSYVYLLVDKKEKDVQLYCNKNGVDLEGKYFKGYINYIRFKIKDESSFKVYLGPIEKRIADYSRIFLVNDGIYNLLNKMRNIW